MSDQDKWLGAAKEPDENWAKSVLERLAMEQVRETRRARRWGIFFKSVFLLYLLVILALMLPDELPDATGSKDGHTAIIEIKGIISDETEASADNVISGLRDAFEDKNTKAVILRINSPGGSPVQSSYIHDEINRLSKKYEDIPVYAVVTDVCASGGYYIASAADQIYVDKSSVVGSIGVLMDGYGFVDTIDKIGVERRLMTAGEHKGILDPFSPVDPFEKQHVQGLLDNLHKHFINAVKDGRGNRLKENDQIFSGLFWSGEEAVELGLADEFGSSSYVAREVVGAEELKDFTKREDVFQKFAEQLGASMTKTFLKVTGMTPELSFK
jgi:protease-4